MTKAQIINQQCRPADKTGHLFDYSSPVDTVHRGNPPCPRVKYRCARCGREFTVAYGLQLQLNDVGKLMPLNQYGVMFA